MKYINSDAFTDKQYESYPFPHIVLDGFIKTQYLQAILQSVNSLKDENADAKFVNPKSTTQYNKYAFNTNYGTLLEELFIELNSEEFISQIEALTGITGIIAGDIRLRGAGVHRIKSGGYLQLHTDFNFYETPSGDKLDRRINLLIYLNSSWKDSYNGHLFLCDKQKGVPVKKISPLLNRCVIFNTSKNSVHGHPVPLNTPEPICRQSIAVYYYTKNTNGTVDFEGDPEHSTIWYPQISVKDT